MCRGGPCVRPALAREQKKRSGRGRKRKGETEGRHTHVFLSERHTRLPRPAHARTSLSLQPRCALHARPMHSQGSVRRPEGGISPPPPPVFSPRRQQFWGRARPRQLFQGGGTPAPPPAPHRPAVWCVWNVILACLGRGRRARAPRPAVHLGAMRDTHTAYGRRGWPSPPAPVPSPHSRARPRPVPSFRLRLQARLRHTTHL